MTVPDPTMLTLAEASKLCHVAKPTIRARREQLVAHGATVSERRWRIPPAALVATGLLKPTTPIDPTPGKSLLEEERERIHELEVRNAVLVSENKQLNERIDDLHERIESLEAALAREQSRGLFGWLRHHGDSSPRQITKGAEE
jgi:cell division protein FtsB